MRMAEPVRCRSLGDLPGELASEPVHQVIDAVGLPWGEAGFTVEVDEDVGGVEVVGGQVRAELAQLPHVLAVESAGLVGDIEAPVAALGPDLMLMLARNDLDERGVTAAGVPIAVLQPERFAQAKPGLGKKGPQQPVTD